MPRMRATTIDRIQNGLSNAALAWSPSASTDSLAKYSIKYGILHLLSQDRKTEVEACLRDLFFMQAFCDAWPTVITPLMAWREVGLDRLQDAYKTVMIEPHEPIDKLLAADGVASFLDKAGQYSAGLELAERVVSSVEFIERLDIEHKVKI